MQVRSAARTELKPAAASSPRREAAARRDAEFRRALNLAATLPASEVVIIEPTAGETLAGLRAALASLMLAEPRDLTWGIRDGALMISKGALPPKRRRPKGG